MSYLGRSAKLSLKAQEKVSFLATAGQTSKTGLSYTPSFIEVYVNGVLLTDNSDFTATNGNSITFTVALLLNDEVTVISLKTFTVADHYTKSDADTLLAAKAPVASPSFTGTVSADGLVVDSSGAATTFVEFKNSTGSGKFDIKQGGANNTIVRGYNSSNAETIRLDPTSDTFFNGSNVGIGTESPSYKLDVDAGAPSSADKIISRHMAETSRQLGLVWDDSASTMGIATLTNHSLSFHTNGINPRMTIDNAGRVTKPLQPAFRVSNAGGGDYTTIGYMTFGNAMLNTGTHYSTSTGKFTAPIAGRYYLAFRALTRSASHTNMWVGINVNGTALTQTYHTHTNHSNISAESIVSLSANDYVQVYLGGGGLHSGSGHDKYTFFQGYLLG